MKNIDSIKTRVVFAALFVFSCVLDLSRDRESASKSVTRPVHVTRQFVCNLVAGVCTCVVESLEQRMRRGVNSSPPPSGTGFEREALSWGGGEPTRPERYSSLRKKPRSREHAWIRPSISLSGEELCDARVYWSRKFLRYFVIAYLYKFISKQTSAFSTRYYVHYDVYVCEILHFLDTYLCRDNDSRVFMRITLIFF